MPLDTAFRLSFYVALGAACACLAQAEAFFMAWFPFVFMPVAAAAFVLAWRHEGRWVLHDTAANYVGTLIGLAALCWLLLQLPRSEEDLIAGGVPWPAGLLPHLGPLLVALLVVRLFRPKKLADFWAVQTIGLMMATLGCVLAGDPVFAAFLVVYVTGLVWCLGLFYLYRARRTAPAAPLFDAVGDGPAAAPGEPLPWRLGGAGRALRWSALVLGSGAALFLLMPRSGNAPWVPQRLSAAAPTLNVGIEAGINLNRVGTIELSPEPAFHVTVTDAAGKPATLPPNPYWRAFVLDYYFRGRWISWGQAQEFENAPVAATPVNAVRPPAGGRLQVHFAVRKAQAGNLVLAEPVDIRYVGLDVRVGDGTPRIDLFHAVPGADSVLSFAPGQRVLYRYSQFIEPAGDRIPARSFEPSYLDYLLAQPAPDEVGPWARERLATLPGLTAAERQPGEHGRLPPEHHAAVARAFCRYFTGSGDFAYSLQLRRVDRSIDPAVDFLFNVKEGHCERFAAGLALSLRSLGIPARIIKGYRGAEEDEEPGKYVVRLDQAHSWVQVLVQADGGWYWLVLDPTPGNGASDNRLADWLSWLGGLDGVQLWNRFVMNYNADVQASTAHYLLQGLRQIPTGPLLWQAPLGLAAAGALFVAWRGRSRWRGLLRLPGRGGRTGLARRPGFYGRLLDTLARRLGLRPQPGQTPLEFAAVAADALRRDADTAAWATLPEQAARVLYHVRFGGYRLDPAEEEALGRQVTGLDRALTARR
jgi:hypothetical protein